MASGSSTASHRRVVADDDDDAGHDYRRATPNGDHHDHHAPEDLQEGLDGPTYSDAGEADASRLHRKERGCLPNESALRRRERIRYQRAIVVAVTVAVVGAGIELSISKLSRWKLRVVEILTRHERYGAACGFLCAVSLGLGLVASLAVVGAPRAKGSGIPEIKTYLNGVSPHPAVITETTLAAKVVGIVCAVAGGLLCGKEGPMVHVGAVVGAVVAQGRSELQIFGASMRQNARPRAREYKFLSTDAEKAEFVAVGCACGVSSAFGSPIGGVLFMIEEALSFWKQRLFFRAAFAATVNCVVIVVLLSKLRTSHGFSKHTLKFEGMAVFDDFNGDRNRDYPSTLLLLCVAQGALVGLWGAGFVEANRRLTLWRQRHVGFSDRRKIAEVLVVMCGTALTAYVPCVLFTKRFCRRLDGPNPDGADEAYASRFQCADDEYNELATLTLASLPRAIAALFHQTAIHAFSKTALAYFFCYASFWTCVTYGITVPSGLFIPSILSGAAFGRLFAVIVLPLIYQTDSAHNLGLKTQKLAIAGGIAGLAATTRMTVSIVVIFASTILDGANLVPILVSCLASKLAGDAFNEGLYDVHIELNHYKYMEDEPPEHFFHAKPRGEDAGDDVGASAALANNKPAQVVGVPERPSSLSLSPRSTTSSLMTVSPPPRGWSTDVACVMTPHVTCVDASARHADLVDALRLTAHHGFPVLRDDGTYLGLISRSQLAVVLMQARLPSRRDDPDEAKGGLPAPLGASGAADESGASWAVVRLRVHGADARDFFPHFPHVDDLPPCPASAVVDLTPFVNKSSPVVGPETNARYVWSLFRSTRTRHVVVVDDTRHVVGIVTRSDLLGRSDRGAGTSRRDLLDKGSAASSDRNEVVAPLSTHFHHHPSTAPPAIMRPTPIASFSSSQSDADPSGNSTTATTSRASTTATSPVERSSGASMV